MSGTIVGAAPWTREAIRQYHHRYPDAFAAMEAAIPDGLGVVITAGRSPGQWGAVLREARSATEVDRVPSEHNTIASAVYAVLAAPDA